MLVPLVKNRIPLGWLVAPLTRFVPKGAVLPILQGPGRGIRWVVGSGMPNFWLGTYEREKYELFHRAISRENVVYDIGANVGIYSVLACRTVGINGRVFAFEPSPANLSYLNSNIRANRFSNCEVIPQAVSDADGVVQFEFGNGSCLGKISSNGPIRVPSVSLDSFVANGKPLPDVMKIDVEGAEYEVLTGARKVISKARPTIFLATHGEEIHAKCCSLLRDFGYQLQLLAPDEVVARRSS
jgi:FkbM family methyltransferase